MLWGCGNRPNENPGGGTNAIPVDPSARLGWDQQAASIDELNSLRYVAYVDGTRTELAGASCSTTPGSAGYPCSARLPPMTAGQHTLELASYIVLESVIESARSAPLTIALTAPTGVTAVTNPQDMLRRSPPSVPAARAQSREITTGDGARLRVDVVTVADDPSALAVAEDGSVFVGYGAGRVRLVRNRQVIADEALSADEATDGSPAILDLALDAEFGRNHLLYALEVFGGDSPTFRLSRFREAGGRLGERAVLLDRVPAARLGPAASLAFANDNRLFVGFDDADDPNDARRVASYNGKVLRLNADGTVPADEPNGSPVYASDFRAPGSLTWDAESASLWVADQKNDQVRRLRRGSGRQPQETAFTLPTSAKPASIAIYRGALIPSLRGNLLMALAGEQQYLVRARLNSDETTVAAIERLPIPGDSSVRLVETSSNGAIYVATDHEVLRLIPR